MAAITDNPELLRLLQNTVEPGRDGWSQTVTEDGEPISIPPQPDREVYYIGDERVEHEQGVNGKPLNRRWVEAYAAHKGGRQLDGKNVLTEAEYLAGADEAMPAELADLLRPMPVDFMTKLTSFGPLLTKKIAVGADGKPIVTGDDVHPKNFSFERLTVRALADILALLQLDLGSPRSCIVRGQLREGLSPERQRRLLKDDAKTGDKATIEDAAHFWVPLDLDSVPCPDGLDPIADPEAAVRHVISLLPGEFRDRDVVWQLTSSAGIKPGIRLRLYFWSDRPLSGDELIKWIGQHPLIDKSVFFPAEPIYTAAPVFEGLADPVPRRVGLLQGESRAITPAVISLEPAAVEPRSAAQPGGELQADDMMDVAAALAVIGNPDLPYSDWIKIGLALFAATGGSDLGLMIFRTWSAKSSKYDETTTSAKWEDFHQCPPDRSGAGTIFWHAKQACPGWRRPSLYARDAMLSGSGDVASTFKRFEGQDNGSADPIPAQPDDPDWPGKEPLEPAHRENSDTPRTRRLPDNFPAPLLNYARDVAARTGFDEVPIGVSMIFAAAAAIHTGCRIRPDPIIPEYATGPNIWLKLVGPSGSGKTPSTKDYAIKPLEGAQEAASRSYKQKLAAWLTQDEAHKAQQSGLKQGSLIISKDDAGLQHMVAEPGPKPAEPTFLISEGTTAAIADVVVEAGGRGTAVFYEEIEGFYGQMGQYGKSAFGSVADRTFWQKSFDGGRFSQKRAGGGGKTGTSSREIADLRLSLAGGIPPSQMREVLAKMRLEAAGMVQRFIVCMTYARPPGAPRGAASVDKAAMAEYYSVIQHLTQLAPADVVLAPDALEARAEWQCRLQQWCWALRNEPRLHEHLQKMREISDRITLIFHAIDSALQPIPADMPPTHWVPQLIPTVRRETVEAAVVFVEHTLLPESCEFYRIFFDEGGASEDVRQIARWLVAAYKDRSKDEALTFSPSDILRHVRRLRNRTRDLHEAMGALTNMRWVRPVEIDKTFRQAKKWECNPRIAEDFSGEIEVIAAERGAAHAALRHLGKKR